MNKQLKTLFVLAFAMVMSVTSCLNENEDTNSGAAKLPSNVVSFADQVEAMKNSVVEIEAIQSSLTEMSDLQATASHFETCAAMIEEHIASIESGVTGVPAVVAAMNIQSKVAAATGALKVDLALLDVENAAELQSAVLSIENGVKSWLGKDFKSYFEVSSEAARLGSMIDIVEEQSLSADAMMSDVEAGLRVGDATEDLKALIATVGNTSETLIQLNDKMVSLCTEVEGAYMSLFNAEADSKENLKTVNTKAGEVVKSSTTTLADLASRISACEATIADIDSRLEKVEADVAELLGMIQSVTFMSEYSEDYAYAYYNMDINTKVSDENLPYNGKAQRTATGTMELTYMVRPAAAAKALNANLNAVKVIGYYAKSAIATKAPLAADYIDFAITKVATVNETRGLVTVTVTPTLREAFYYKEIGAKCALSLQSGKTDVVSTFVEIFPKENSNRVYVESVSPSTDYIKIKKGESAELTATVYPGDVTTSGCYFSSSDSKIAEIDGSTGKISAKDVGTTVITITSKGTDEWGLPVTATCTVDVEEAFVLTGAPHVVVGQTEQLYLTYPSSAIINEKVWKSSDESKLTVDEEGKVRGVAHTYNTVTKEYSEVTVSCTINGVTTVSWPMKVASIQPQAISTPALGEATEISIKVNESLNLESIILPVYVPENAFKITYQSDQGLGWINYDTGVIDANRNSYVTTSWVTITVENYDKEKYYISDSRLKKTVIVKVEPYYVQTMTFAQDVITLAPDQVSVLSPVFTSDVEGHAPTFAELEWVSSNPSVVSVNAQTGEITTLAEGSAVITAITTNINAVPSGQSQKSASCTVVVETPQQPVNVGDYFYSDGTWSTTRDNSKTVIGVVFASVGAATSDPHLMADYPTATHGLVVSTKEYNSAMIADRGWGRTDCTNWWDRNGYTTYSNTSQPVGYANTKAHEAVNAANIQSYGYTIDWTLFNTSSPFATHKKQVATPTGTSSWYVPSFAEMKLMKENLDKVNSVLSGISGASTINGTNNYWCSSHRDFASGWFNAFSMSSNGWTSVTTNYNTVLPFRVVLAF